VATGRVVGKHCARKRQSCNTLYCPAVCLAGLRRITRNPNQDSRFTDEDGNLSNLNRVYYTLESESL
jgi:hypothetical protein